MHIHVDIDCLPCPNAERGALPGPGAGAGGGRARSGPGRRQLQRRSNLEPVPQRYLRHRQRGRDHRLGGGNYCPKDYVTREQMAAFMNRLGALQAGKTPVVNADKVDGFQGSTWRWALPHPLGCDRHRRSHLGRPSRCEQRPDPIYRRSACSGPFSAQRRQFAPSLAAIDDDATCTGTPVAPTAPAGKVCISSPRRWPSTTPQEGDGVSGFETRAFSVPSSPTPPASALIRASTSPGPIRRPEAESSRSVRAARSGGG